MEGLFEHFVECKECKCLVYQEDAVVKEYFDGTEHKEMTFCSDECHQKHYLLRLRFYGM